MTIPFLWIHLHFTPNRHRKNVYIFFFFNTLLSRDSTRGLRARIANECRTLISPIALGWIAFARNYWWSADIVQRLPEGSEFPHPNTNYNLMRKEKLITQPSRHLLNWQMHGCASRGQALVGDSRRLIEGYAAIVPRRCCFDATSFSIYLRSILPTPSWKC